MCVCVCYTVLTEAAGAESLGACALAAPTTPNTLAEMTDF